MDMLPDSGMSMNKSKQKLGTKEKWVILVLKMYQRETRLI